jgi:hypothetical protein
LVPERESEEEVMMALATFLLGLAIFGLFFAMVAGCEQL